MCASVCQRAGCQLQGLLRRGLDVAAQSLRQRFCHTDALAVAPQSISLRVPGIWILRVCRLLRLSPLRHPPHKQVELGFFLVFQVIGVNAGGLVGHRDAIAAGF